MSIHSSHPFADPDGAREAARQLRGRLGGQVSLWTAGSGAGRAGLTVSSLLVVPGAPPYVLALLDPDSDLADVLGVADERCVIHLLQWRHRDLAEQFAGQMPAPGGLFAADTWLDTPAGPRLADIHTWAEGTVESSRRIGWSLEVLVRLDRVEVGDADDPLLHRRGRYSH